MNAELTAEETAKIYIAARDELYAGGAPYDGPDKLNKLVSERVAHALRMKELRFRVEQELQGALW